MYTISPFILINRVTSEYKIEQFIHDFSFHFDFRTKPLNKNMYWCVNEQYVLNKN